MKEISPLPWRVTSEGYIASNAGSLPIATPFRERAHRDKHGGVIPEARANAEYIVRAVNNHDSLVHVLCRLVEQLSQGGVPEYCKEQYEEAQAVIEQVGNEWE